MRNIKIKPKIIAYGLGIYASINVQEYSLYSTKGMFK